MDKGYKVGRQLVSMGFLESASSSWDQVTGDGQGLWTQLSHLPHGAASDLGSLFVTSEPAKGPTLEAPKWPTLPHHSGDFVLCHACSMPPSVEPGDEPGQPLFPERTFPKLPGTPKETFCFQPQIQAESVLS